jgi:hypothetical protein
MIRHLILDFLTFRRFLSYSSYRLNFGWQHPFRRLGKNPDKEQNDFRQRIAQYLISIFFQFVLCSLILRGLFEKNFILTVLQIGVGS